MRRKPAITLMRCLAIFLAALLALAAPLSAQDAPVVLPVETWERQVNTARDVIDAGAASADALAQLRTRLEAQRAEANGFAAKAAERIAGFEAELAALGPPPAEGETEDADAAALRADLNRALATARANRGQALRAATRVDGLLTDLAALGTKRFIARLETRAPSPLSPSTWVAAGEALSDATSRIAREAERTIQSAAERQRIGARAGLAVGAILLGVFVLFGLRGAALGFLQNRARTKADRGQRLAIGVGATAARLIIAAVAAGLIFFGLGSIGVFGVVGDATLRGFGRGIAYLIAAYALSSALFSPNSPELRVASMPDGPASRAHRATMWLGGALAIHAVLIALAEAIDAEPAARSAFTFVAVLIGALALWRLASTLRVQAAGVEATSVLHQGVQVALRLSLAVAVTAPFLALLGFEFAARFIFIASVVSLAIFAAGYFIFRVVRDGVDAYLGDDPETGGRLRLLPFLVGFLLICAALPLLALAWGADFADLHAAYVVAADGLRIGEVAISPLDFVLFALVFGAGYTVTRIVQRVLSGSVFPQTGVSEGASVALTSGVGYVGVFLAALAAISATGLDLSNLAIVAGALSVGIGFGLQNIVNNFVSGVILLVERPIKVGDWIEAGGQAGYVKKVNVRSTEIETFDRASFIVPNSDLISGSVLNWTHSDMTGRVRVPVGVEYGTDTRKVESLLYEIGKAHPMVLTNPGPSVFFMGFGADSLDFELRVYLRDVNWMLTVKSDLNFRIAERFAEEGIEIPFAQRDINIRNPEALGRALRGEP